MSGGKNNPEYLFYLAGWKHIKKEDYDYYQKSLDNGSLRQLQINKDGSVLINHFENQFGEATYSIKLYSIKLTDADVKALYFKLRSLGFCKDEKKK